MTGLIGDTVKVVVTATNVAGSHSATSSPSGVIAGIVPANQVLPSITGSLLSGQLLTAHPGTWSGSEPITYGYQWQLCNALGKACANIGEATGSTFKLVGLDVGLTLDLVVTAKNVAGFEFGHQSGDRADRPVGAEPAAGGRRGTDAPG